MSDRKLDSKGRWRSRVVAFRVSDEEAELLNRLVDISGLTKQDYLIKKTTDRKVVVKGCGGISEEACKNKSPEKC